jgi:hypothetical protein
MGSGKIIKCMEGECLHGLMEGNMKGNTLKTKNKEWEHFIGLMEGNMWGSGKMENNMGKEHLLH